MDHFAALDNVDNWKKTRRGVELSAGLERVRFDFIRADILRIKISQGGIFDPAPTFSVTSDELGAIEFSVRATSRGLVIKSGSLTLRVQFAPFHFDVERADGSCVVRSVPGQAYRFLNNTWRMRRMKTPGDTILGLGEKTQPFNHDGRKLTMWNVDVYGPDLDGVARVHNDRASPQFPLSDRFDPYYISINFFYHLSASDPGRASASFVDCGYRMHYDFQNPAFYEISGDGSQLTEYIFAGPAIRDILHGYTDLTGRMDPPPIWALGHHQCRWYDYSQQDVRKLAAKYRRKGIPCDSLWLDIDYMDGYRVFTWNRKRFPDPEELISNLRKQGFRLITIIDPGVKFEPGYPVFDEGLERGLFCKTENGQVYVGQVWPGRTAFPDFVKEESRRWWGRLNADHVRRGIAGIWNDMNEPSTGTVSPLPMRFDYDGANYPHERYHNQYGMLMAMGTVSGLRDAMPGRRTFVLSRAGFAGIQRYAANWTGDNAASWEHLVMSLSMNANLGLSGQPFVGSDIGGFTENTTAELLVRWYQYSVFQPFMRNHLGKGSVEHYPWSFGKDAETHIREAIRLRYRLMPYIYTAFMQSAETGDPIQRPLVYDWQDDHLAVANATEFMFGDHLLVAPVITRGATKRQLYLPRGMWRCFYSGVAYNGGRVIEVDAELGHLPLFVRAGAVIPAVEPPMTTDGQFPETVDLLVYVPDRNGVTESLLHEDDGLTDDWRKGAFWRTGLRVERKGRRLTVSAKTDGDGFVEGRRRRFRLVFKGARLSESTFACRGQGFSKTFMLPQ